MKAYLRSISEIGEDFIFHNNKLVTSTGLAGGFLKREIVLRAKAEVFEREAIHFHEINNVPFLTKEKVNYLGINLIVCQLSSASFNHKVYLVTGVDDIIKDKLIVGTSASVHQKVALDSAIETYISHRYCSTMEDYRHHPLFKDEMLKKLINTHAQINKRKYCLNEYDASFFDVISISEHPLKFFKYYFVKNKKLSYL